jgi:hypothetical protein
MLTLPDKSGRAQRNATSEHANDLDVGFRASVVIMAAIATIR